MKTPRFLIGFALLLWGVQTGFFIFAALMAVILEASQFIKSRWEFSEKEYHRIFDLCLLLLIGALGIATTSDEIRIPALALARWFPFIFFPIIAAQVYGSREKLSLRTLSPLLRRKKGGFADKELNISYIYLSMCVFSASAMGPGLSGGGFFSPFGIQTFYFAIAVILIWALYPMRSRRVHGSVWMVLIGCVTFFGYFGHIGLHEMQKYLESAVTNWLGKFARLEANLLESQTALGRIGEVKLSDKIIMRLEPQNGSRPPGLLRQVTYDTYANTVWRATRQESGQIAVGTNEVWEILPNVSPKASVRISGNLRRGTGVLALPAGTVKLRDLQVGNLSTNVLGMTKVEFGLQFLRFIADFTRKASIESTPVADDFDQIPEKEEETLAQIVTALGLNSPEKTLEEKLRIIHSYFQNHFTYSTYITAKHIDPEKKKSAVTMFLTETRSGHCEYFATATVLLARKAGIPARYSTGFAVQESSSSDMYVIRERHAHAWASIYRNGVWEDFDTTPASWDEIEAKQASLWQPISDFWSRLTFEFSKWRYSKTNIREYAIWLLIPLALFLAWRIVFKRKRKRTGIESESKNANDWPGLDSELYEMEKELAERGLMRSPSESLGKWKERVHAAGCVPTDSFTAAVELHSRYRFDPLGLKLNERELLRENVKQCLRMLRDRRKNQEMRAEVNSQTG